MKFVEMTFRVRRAPRPGGWSLYQRVPFFLILGLTQCLVPPTCRAQGAPATDLYPAAAEAAHKAGGAEQAIRLYRKALVDNPGWADGWKSLGLLLADRGEYSEAQEAFQNFVKERPQNGDGWALLGICEFRQGKYGLAIEHLEMARGFEFADNSLFRLAHYYTAVVMIMRRDFDTALVRLLLLSREGVASEDLMEAYGLAALRIPALPGTEESALRPVVKEVGALVARSRHMDVGEARKSFEKLLAEHPYLPGLEYAYGDYLATHGLYGEACKAFNSELQNSPQDAMAKIQIAAIRSQNLNDPDGGLPLAQEAVQSAPDLFAGHLVLGKILLKLGETDRAIGELELAARQAPRSAMVHTTLLHAYNKAGRKIDAAREEDTLRRLQLFEASLKGQGSDVAAGGRSPQNTAASRSEVK